MVIVFIVLGAIAALAILMRFQCRPSDSEVGCGGWGGWTRKILLENGVHSENVEDCLSWAFGSGFESLQLRELDDKWRELHSDLFMIEGSDCVIESTKKIANAYIKFRTN